MANLKERLLGLVNDGANQAINLINGINDTVSAIDWDAHFDYLNDKKNELLKRGEELFGDFNELLKQVTNNLTDFEVTVPFDETLGEKFEYTIEDGKLTIMVSFKDENTERSNKTVVLIPQNCDLEKATTKYNTVMKTMTVVIPKTFVETTHEEGKPSSEEEAAAAAAPSESGYKLHTTARKRNVRPTKVAKHNAEEETNVTSEVAKKVLNSKLARKIKENTEKGNMPPRAANGQFVRRNPQGEGGGTSN